MTLSGMLLTLTPPRFRPRSWRSSTRGGGSRRGKRGRVLALRRRLPLALVEKLIRQVRFVRHALGPPIGLQKERARSGTRLTASFFPGWENESKAIRRGHLPLGAKLSRHYGSGALVQRSRVIRSLIVSWPKRMLDFRGAVIAMWQKHERIFCLAVRG